MQKILIFAKKTLLLLFFVSVIAEAQINKKIILEDLTASWCGLCPEGHVTFDKVLSNFDNVIGVNVHINDPMSTPVSSEASDTYSGGGVNVFLLDRHWFSDLQFVQFSFEYDPLAAKIKERLEAGVSVGVGIQSAVFNPTTRDLSVTIAADFLTNFIDPDFRFNLWISEKTVQSTESGYAQANFFVGYGDHQYANAGNPILNFEHKNVLRESLGGLWGTANSLPNIISAGSQHTYTYEIKIPNEWNINELQLIPLIQQWNDDHHFREIINADEVSMMDALAFATNIKEQIDLNLFNVNIFPNPSSQFLNIEFNIPKSALTMVTMYDITGQNVANIYSQHTNKGSHKIQYNIQNIDNQVVKKGIYFIKISSSDFEVVKKVTVF